MLVSGVVLSFERYKRFSNSGSTSEDPEVVVSVILAMKFWSRT